MIDDSALTGGDECPTCGDEVLPQHEVQAGDGRFYHAWCYPYDGTEDE